MKIKISFKQVGRKDTAIAFVGSRDEEAEAVVSAVVPIDNAVVTVAVETADDAPAVKAVAVELVVETAVEVVALVVARVKAEAVDSAKVDVLTGNTVAVEEVVDTAAVDAVADTVAVEVEDVAL